MFKFTKTTLVSVLERYLFKTLYAAKSEQEADEFINDLNLPKECIWSDKYNDGSSQLTLLGYLNGVILATGSDKRLIVEEDGIVKFEKFENIHEE